MDFVNIAIIRRGEHGVFVDSDSNGLIALDSSDNLYSLQSLGHRNYTIDKFVPNGTEISNFNQTDIVKTIKDFPKGIAVDSFGNIYVSVVGSSFKTAGIKKFDSDGKLLKDLKNYTVTLENGVTRVVKVLGAGDIAVDPFDKIYLVDQHALRFSPPILKFSSNGTFIDYNIIFNETTGTGISNIPNDIATDSQGNLYVLDNAGVDCLASFSSNTSPISFCTDRSVQKFSSNGDFITFIIHAGEGPNEIDFFPQGLDIDSFNRVYVTEAAGNQIFVFAPNKTSTTFLH